MRAFVCNLMAAMLLVHALVGCCLHHEHGSARHEGVETSESRATHCCHHADDYRGQDEESAPAPCDCKIECKALCIYLPPEKWPVNAGDMSLAFHRAIVEYAAAARALVAVAMADSISNSALAHSGLEPPVRLHLLHQIILV